MQASDLKSLDSWNQRVHLLNNTNVIGVLDLLEQLIQSCNSPMFP